MEAIHPYPRYEGRLASSSRLPVLLAQEIRRAFTTPWALAILISGLGIGLGSIVEFHTLRESGAASHDGRGYTLMLSQLLWWSLALAAALGGPAIQQDVRAGAAELYYSRAVRRWEYVGAKVLALLLLTSLPILLSALAYWGMSYVLYDAHPAWWARAFPGAIAYALMWAALVSGLALGFSAVARGSGAVALTLFAAFASLDYLVDPPALFERFRSLTDITEDPRVTVLSPFAWMDAMQGALFGDGHEADFPVWWGALAWALATLGGWALLLWRHPRPRGETDA